MHLATMMNVVQEEMGKQIPDAFRDDSMLATISCNPPVQIGCS
jgi:hypothetical protein